MNDTAGASGASEADASAVVAVAAFLASASAAMTSEMGFDLGLLSSLATFAAFDGCRGTAAASAARCAADAVALCVRGEWIGVHAAWWSAKGQPDLLASVRRDALVGALVVYGIEVHQTVLLAVETAPTDVIGDGRSCADAARAGGASPERWRWTARSYNRAHTPGMACTLAPYRSTVWLGNQRAHCTVGTQLVAAAPAALPPAASPVLAPLQAAAGPPPCAQQASGRRLPLPAARHCLVTRRSSAPRTVPPSTRATSPCRLPFGRLRMHPPRQAPASAPQPPQPSGTVQASAWCTRLWLRPDKPETARATHRAPGARYPRPRATYPVLRRQRRSSSRARRHRKCPPAVRGAERTPRAPRFF